MLWPGTSLILLLILKKNQLQQFQDLLEMDQAMVDQAAEKLQKISELTVASAMFDFCPHVKVRIPLSWKLTTRQKQNLDDAWRVLREGAHPGRPLAVLDRYFEPLSR